MTDTMLDYDPSGTGEIPRPIGETRTRIDTGEATQRIDPRLINAPSYEAIPRRVIDIDDTVQFRLPPEAIGVVEYAGPQSPPPPLPKPPRPSVPPRYDMAAAQPVAPWERVADTERLSLLGSLGADLPEVAFPPRLRRSVPYVLPAHRAPWSGPRHAAPAPLWTRLAVAAGVALTLGSVVGLAVLAVIR